MSRKRFVLNAEAVEQLDDESLDKLVEFLNREAESKDSPDESASENDDSDAPSA